MKTEPIYRAPELSVAETNVEEGFAASGSRIDDPTNVTEGSDYWG